MIQTIGQSRRPPVLTPAAVPCLQGVHAINITRGCGLGCTYCYIQGHSAYPGARRVILHDNTPQLLLRKLAHAQQRPRRVYFCPSCDAFQHIRRVQEVTFRVMSILLDAGIEIAFLTKGFVTRRFLRLFQSRPHLVFPRVGLTTTNASICRAFEPYAAPPRRRLAYLKAFRDGGLAPSVRLDPLIPDLTDTDDNLAPLFFRLAEIGVARVTAAFLFLRPSFALALTRQVEHHGVDSLQTAPWEFRRFLDGSTGALLLAWDQRAARLDRIARLGARFGLDVTGCRCRDPELDCPSCLVAGPPLSCLQS